jgi:flagellar hook-associated protein 2
MAIQASGIISGLDVGSLITASMAFERLPLERMQRQLSSTESKISAMGQIKSAIASLQEAAKGISDSAKLYSYKGSLVNADIASVTANGKAVAGTYSLEVERLASSHKLTSASNINTSAGGTLTIEIGGVENGNFVAKDGNSPISVNVAAGASLSDIAKAINDADAGVSATVVNGAGGAQLVLTGEETGENNQIKITTTESIKDLRFDPANPTNNSKMTQTAAQNAIVRIDGILLANTTSNTITDAVTGVDLTLKSTNKGSPTQLTISNDTADFEGKLKTFVDAYNKARDTMKNLSSYDAANQSAAVLNGDSTVTSALNELRGMLSEIPAGASGAYQHLSELGVETSAQGVLSINADKFKSAMQTDFAAVTKTVAAYGAAYEAAATRMNGADGLIGHRLDGLNSTKSALNDSIAAQERRMEIVQARYEKQFANLETLLSSLTATGNYLSQQLSSLSSSS